MNETSHFNAGEPLVFSSVSIFLMIKRRKKEGGKAFLAFFKLFLTVSLFTNKNLAQAIGSNYINIYLPSNLLYDRVSISDTAEAECCIKIKTNIEERERM